MTTVAAIQNDLEDISKTLTTLGMAQPTCELHIRAHSTFYGSVTYHDEHDERKYIAAFGDTAAEVISKMYQQIGAIPSKEDRDRETYLRHIAKAIEFGKRIGIDEQFINPLELQMKRLSANIIEYRPNFDDEEHTNRLCDEDTTRAVHNDDIPF